MARYFFQIMITGETEDLESVCDLYENLRHEIWHENSKVHPPTYRELKEGLLFDET